MVKRALVVDDSKSARFALKRMLKTLKLEVDTVESAADAISYLQDHLPDVIFMDHMMPGMDGFEAVKRIKDNPQTAIIPIMMYTSKGGDVYLSQARALGAVGIIRKTIAPVELKSALQELGLIDDIPHESSLKVDKPAEENLSQLNKTSPDAVKPAELQKENTLEFYIKDLHRLIDDQTIELHRSMWLGIESASNEIFNRLNSDFEEKLEKIQAQSQENKAGEFSLFNSSKFWPVFGLSVLLVISIATNIILMSDSDTSKTQRVDDVVKLPKAGKEKSYTGGIKMLAEKTDIPVEQQSNLELQQKFIQWASNKIIEYPYDEVALNDKRLPNIQELIKKAIEARFKGRIILQTHAGNFCLNIDQMGNYKLADSKLSIVNCEFIGNYIQPNDESTSHQSLSFVNFLSDSEHLNQQGIAIEVQSMTRRIELSQYPERIPQTTADKWNQAAQLNNRITVMLEPDSVDL